MKRLGIATMVLIALGVGLWIGWHKDVISAHLSQWHSNFNRAIPSPSASPLPLTLPESPVETTVETPAPWPSLVDQLRREGVELRDRGDMTTAVDRFNEALDSEPNNAAVLSELAKTYEAMELYDRANEIWRKLQEIGPSAGVAYELADRQLKLRPSPAETAAPMATASDSSAPEVSALASPTATNSGNFAAKPREREIEQVPVLPTSTPRELSSPISRASAAEPMPSEESAVAQEGGRLIVLRSPNFGWNLAVNLKIDGKTAANIVQGSRYDEVVSAGRHTLTVSAVPNYQPSSTVLNVQHGETYVFTAKRQNADRVVLVPSALR
jgi:tetratricopeptide (TPR) repeat protein